MSLTPTRGVIASFAAAATVFAVPTGASLANPVTRAAAGLQISISYPTEGKVGTGPLTVTGGVSGGDVPRASVVYAVDVSGSTASPSGLDCNGDEKSTELDDFNIDGSSGDTLDCEISGVTSLNAALRAVADSASRIRTGVVGFGSLARLADLSPGPDIVSFVAPGATGGDRDVVPRINKVTGSLTRGQIGLETLYDVGTGTDFQNPIDVATSALTSQPGDKWVLLLSDGLANMPDMTAAVSAGIHVRTFAVGTAATCQPGSPLYEIAHATGETCVAVADPSTLTNDILSTAPAAIRSVHVRLDDRASVLANVDALGNWSAAVGQVAAGRHRIVAEAVFQDGGTDSASVSFSAGDGVRYVALGDSYSSGEGVAPYVDQRPKKTTVVRGQKVVLEYEHTRGFLCHRSQRGWPRLVTWPGDRKPLAETDGSRDLLDFTACSGARIVNADTEEQPKEYAKTTTYLPLQLTRLGADDDLVTLTMGGNDVGFAEILQHCASQLNCWKDRFVTVRQGTSTEQDVSLEDWAQIRIALAQNELGGLYRAIKDRVGPQTVVVVATYPRLLSVKPSAWFGVCTERSVFTKGERQWLADRVDDFDEAILEQAKRVDFAPADVRKEFDNNSVCDHDNWIAGITPARGTDLSGGLSMGSFHPNEHGTAAYARVVDDALATWLAKQRSNSRLDASRSTARVSDEQRRAAVRAANAAESNGSGVSGPIDRRAAVAAFVPDALSAYPKDLVDAVAAVTLVPLALGDGAALMGLPSCPEAVVGGERVPYASAGFAPGGSVDVRAVWADHDQVLARVRADDSGTVRGDLRIPGGVPADHVVGIRLEGRNTAGAAALGVAAQRVTDDPECVIRVIAAGLLDTGIGGGVFLPDTGTGRAKALVGIGAVLIALGTFILVRVRRRRAIRTPV